MRTIAVIPARYNSSRFPGKPLALILGKPMIQWVYEGVLSSKLIDCVVVVTDDQRIMNCVELFGGYAQMTGYCNCGTERVFECVKDLDCDIVINVQGDEPLVDSRIIDGLIEQFESDKDIMMNTLVSLTKDDNEIDDPNVVKVVRDLAGDALFFSRNRTPSNARCCSEEIDYYKHIGIYGYRKSFLEKFVSLEKLPNERIEKLEQMRR